MILIVSKIKLVSEFNCQMTINIRNQKVYGLIMMMVLTKKAQLKDQEIVLR